uniref:Glycolipid transfer protein domain-containing protein n=1 Tax=Polytomella parva TaxID=51329 RepID=A0A7S0VAD0_9CHLO|mmetsp:Transcript_33809/g.61044  ORF Transcript_33809/g.61044 Transcript_33809/m.61044 type:complete len:209 (+) Transcript_33809:117-743(+)|eukprot:CAMPEP_0175075826 /NCGR_PEP_ID=MMETSP0052_2-20121109/22299_1 /TAXON_ID=51329 ORGANISM="Polytomella parva, Strain SAG 63-3" /NCGR_SAMPLE_ID=MMETSP0052_2 /ASSEMBLY_ACC=CAM_ASM_000194 /LENGTH=208 /DNA_ID=CAMNT_0016344721 /DNA_START=19 /DNA_END=645 /DNA_ORIENTATION=-
MAQGLFFKNLTESLSELLESGEPYQTNAFAKLCDSIIGIFDHLGIVLQFAKHEMNYKISSLKEATSQYKLLHEIVDEEKKSGDIVVKNSYGRNLHRLILVVAFIRKTFMYLLENEDILLKDAVYKSYGETLSNIHTYPIRTAVWAGLFSLPYRETFIKNIGETDESARIAAQEFVVKSVPVVEKISALFDDAKIPISDLRTIPKQIPA